ncbi:hypothetical protein PP175_25775 (plasmid) [Aneurinibacillus sp. Ricciae_BoGa-3]|uniref:hypothetical protein n=1 Tax=Aneurinibacillus sp. Ricciae_BoGa-3 TaxID=3022697 RepID=UPI0023419D7F|nr:hypothetical protein [Aneurinibacillus sp. Ricciae_BoGa-3]WCK57478.1 hypothetical protein PP175_25775 [Aneurinibacillus sp. Ricciae_BoGa-3]
MNNETIIAIVSIVAMVIVGAIAFVSILAVFCYKQENIRLNAKQESLTDFVKGKAKTFTTWRFDSKPNQVEKNKKKEMGQPAKTFPSPSEDI